MADYEEILETIKLLHAYIKLHNYIIPNDPKSLLDMAYHLKICYDEFETIDELENALAELHIYNYKNISNNLFILLKH